MRLVVLGACLGLAAGLSACAPGYPGGGPGPITLARVDPQDAAERAVVGGVLGSTLGAGLGASFAINPGIGALAGVEVGAPLGAAVGAATAQPLPDYHPIPVAAAAAATPGFYDTWPPGYERPPIASETPPPPQY
jgi:hypothetical protein